MRIALVCPYDLTASGGHAAVISMQGGRFVPIPFAALLDRETGRARIRLIDTASTRYAIARRFMIRLRRDEQEELIPREDVLTGRRFYESAASYLPERRRAELSELQRLILIRFFQPSIRYDEVETDAARARARMAVTTTKGEVLRGEKIVGAHEQVRDAEMERLQSYRTALTRLGRIEASPTEAPRALAALMYNVFVLGIFGMMLSQTPPWLMVVTIATTVVSIVLAGIQAADIIWKWWQNRQKSGVSVTNAYTAAGSWLGGKKMPEKTSRALTATSPADARTPRSGSRCRPPA